MRNQSCLIFKNDDNTFSVRNVLYDHGFFSERTGLSFVLETFMSKKIHADFLKNLNVDFAEVMSGTEWLKNSIKFPDFFDFSSEGHSDYACFASERTDLNNLSWGCVTKNLSGKKLFYYLFDKEWSVSLRLEKDFAQTEFSPLKDVVPAGEVASLLFRMREEDISSLAKGKLDPVFQLESYRFSLQEAFNAFSGWRNLPQNIQNKLLEDDALLIESLHGKTIFKALEKLDPFERYQEFEQGVLRGKTFLPSPKTPKL